MTTLTLLDRIDLPSWTVAFSGPDMLAAIEGGKDIRPFLQTLFDRLPHVTDDIELIHDLVPVPVTSGVPAIYARSVVLDGVMYNGFTTPYLFQQCLLSDLYAIVLGWMEPEVGDDGGFWPRLREAIGPNATGLTQIEALAAQYGLTTDYAIRELYRITKTLAHKVLTQPRDDAA